MLQIYEQDFNVVILDLQIFIFFCKNVAFLMYSQNNFFVVIFTGLVENKLLFVDFYVCRYQLTL